jgi:hypothetical protein
MSRLSGTGFPTHSHRSHAIAPLEVITFVCSSRRARSRGTAGAVLSSS